MIVFNQKMLIFFFFFFYVLVALILNVPNFIVREDPFLEGDKNNFDSFLSWKCMYSLKLKIHRIWLVVKIILLVCTVSPVIV